MGAETTRCPVHDYAEHGREAEELRRCIEAIVEGDKPCSRQELQRVLDTVDARDSLAFIERKDAANG